MANLSLHLKPVPPFRLGLTVWVLRRRPHNLMDRWDGETYRRVLLIGDQPVEVSVSQTAPPEAPELLVEAEGAEPDPETSEILAAALTWKLGLDIDLTEFYGFAAPEPRLQALVQGLRGVKPPRFPNLFEALVNAIACQQLSLTVGIHLLNRLTQAFGVSFPGELGPAQAFPRPSDLAGLQPQDLRDLGFSYNKARTIIDLSQGLVAGETPALRNLASLPDDDAVKTLTLLKGIGRWSAEYVLLRGLGRTHLFPGDDVGARRKLQDWLNLKEPLDYQGVRRVLADFHPYGGLIYFHFLLSQLAAEGHLGDSKGGSR
ncbi:MAG: DNA-3-methyladenine glycosylase 2 family protein [Deltaproteobacteria bacterium]|nr:DNA-3-methyladenine glycosylase 2 family protein [Deltaproteobacteria bacterium]